MNNSNRDIAKLWLAQFDERLAWLASAVEEMPTDEMVAIHSALAERKKKFSDLLAIVEDEAAKRMSQAGAKTAIVESLDGEPLSVEWKASSRRTDVKRDDLIRDVEKLGNQDKHRIDEVTGEVRTVHETQLELLKRCFRFEPRWSDLTAVGIDIDQYAETAWSFGIKTQKAVKL
jgi:hypothetical protein